MVAFSYSSGNRDTLAAGLYLYDRDSGSSRLLLRGDPVAPGDTRFAPDGQALVFSWNREIWTMSIAGDGLRQLTRGYRSAYPSYSGDGEQILYTRKGVGGGARVMDVDGSNDSPLWTCDLARWIGPSRIIGLTVAGLQIRDLTTGNVETVFADGAEDWLDIRRIDASLQADAILLTAAKLGEVDKYNLWKMNLDGTALEKLTSAGADAPNWLKDGTKIIFTNTSDGRLWIIDSDGANPAPLMQK
jgi:Tol biopolymer transport system component